MRSYRFGRTGVAGCAAGVGLLVLLAAAPDKKSMGPVTASAGPDTAAVGPEKMATGGEWDRRAAAKYLDAREVWWQSWDGAKRDQGTVCVSCHTVLPYALARPRMREELGEVGPSAPEQTMLADVTKRVELWDQIEPFYTEPAPLRSLEARGTEAVLNALILASYDAAGASGEKAQGPHLSATTRKAFENAWTLQIPTGVDSGSWGWLNFHNAPWEDVDSSYEGAAFGGLAVSLAPDHYREEAAIQPQLNLLRSYLRRNYAEQPVMNKLAVLWASARLSGLLTAGEQRALAQQVLAGQQADGGWALATFGGWKRHDASPVETGSDGVATGLAVLAIEESGVAKGDSRLAKGLGWLGSHQVRPPDTAAGLAGAAGSWPAASLNKKRDPASDVGRFMRDAATGYAVLAMEASAP